MLFEQFHRPYYLDIEIYRNYFLTSFYKPSANKFVEIEAYPGKEIEQFKLARIMRNNTTVSFNGISFDLPIIAAAINGASIETLKALADKIILCSPLSYRYICRLQHLIAGTVCKRTTHEQSRVENVKIIQISKTLLVSG